MNPVYIQEILYESCIQGVPGLNGTDGIDGRDGIPGRDGQEGERVS
jgi:hypothetical protein